MRTYSSATFAVLSAGTALCRLVASRVEASRLRSLGHPCRFASAFFGGLGGMSLRGQSAYQLRPTAGIIIIGDEVLKGQVRDANSPYFCEKLTKLGVKVCKVSTIADDVDVIADEVRRFSETYTYVFTSGGIGPTHDDRTFESVAKAFDLRLVLHPDLEDFCRVWFKTSDITSVVFKMAKIPENSKLNYGQVVQVSGKKSKFPLISVKNVYMFPGVPPLLRRAMDILAPKLFHHPEFCTWNCELFLDMAEVDAAPVLNKAVSQFPKVTFGSYPVLGHSYYRTQITIEADVREDAEAAEKFLREGISKNQIVEYDRNPYEDRWEKLQKLLADPNKKELHEPIQKSLQVIDKCYNQFKPEEVCLFFNGGKDCTAVLHLVSCFLQHKFPNYRLTAVDVIEDDKAMFPQVHKFIEETEVRYNLELLTYRGSIRGALAQLLVERPRVKAAFLGMRMGDPHAGESETATFAPTDPEWPPMMRVYPILHISYKELWDLIRSLYLPYCNLYDKGFTSLGRTDTTFPNPALQIFQPDSNKLGYLPAHRLADPKKERDGRIKTLPSAQESKKS